MWYLVPSHLTLIVRQGRSVAIKSLRIVRPRETAWLAFCRAAARYHAPVEEVRSVPADAVLTWRRSVYERGLWAVPLAVDAGAGTHGATAAAGRERRLEEWVGRELRALFQSDVSTTTMLVQIAICIAATTACSLPVPRSLVAHSVRAISHQNVTQHGLM